MPFLGSECQRSEFGVYTTNQTPETWPHNVWYPNIPGSCRYQFDLMEAFHWPTDNRRYYIIDEPRGVIVAIGQLNKFGENGIPGLTLIEAFKVVNGRIDFVWAPAFTFGIEDSGWPDWDRPKR